MTLADETQRKILEGQNKVVVVDARIDATAGTRTWLLVNGISWDGNQATSEMPPALMGNLKTNSIIIDIN